MRKITPLYRGRHDSRFPTVKLDRHTIGDQIARTRDPRTNNRQGAFVSLGTCPSMVVNSLLRRRRSIRINISTRDRRLPACVVAFNWADSAALILLYQNCYRLHVTLLRQWHSYSLYSSWFSAMTSLVVFANSVCSWRFSSCFWTTGSSNRFYPRDNRK
ncbi:uncharacterized protein LOC116249829 isoform X2 [Nymphaea colorata]|nr:uncharacterized protein LOC116249829 isoform X2 [Nymphaea colorata]